MSRNAVARQKKSGEPCGEIDKERYVRLNLKSERAARNDVKGVSDKARFGSWNQMLIGAVVQK